MGGGRAGTVSINNYTSGAKRFRLFTYITYEVIDARCMSYALNALFSAAQIACVHYA